MKLVIRSELAKSLKEKKLNYFKKQLIKILEASDEDIEKAGYGIGTVRVWKGEKYRKIAPGKWRKIYDSNTRGARQSINIIRKKIQNAASIDELLQIVMENTNRFMDDNGKLLPIVEELKNTVKESKGRLNNGKPSTQEQIEKFKKKHGKTEVEQFEDDIKEVDAAYTKITHIDIDKKDYEGMKAILDHAKKVYTELNNKLSDPNYEEWGKAAAYERLKNELHPLLSRIQWRYNEVEQNYKKEKFFDGIEKVELQVSDEENKAVDDFHKEIMNFVREHKDSTWKINSDLLNFIDSVKNKKAAQKWCVINLISNYDELKKEVEHKIMREMNREKVEKEKAEILARNEKIEQINQNNELKTYSDEEINKALESVNALMAENAQFKDKIKETSIKENEARNRYHDLLMKHDESRREVWDEVLAYRKQMTKLEEDRFNFEKKLDEYMDPIAYYYLNNYKYKKDDRIENCKTIEEVENLIKSKDWYSEDGKNNINLKKMELNAVKEVFKRLEHIFAIFPEQKGRTGSLYCEPARGNVWAFTRGGAGITFNSNKYSNYSELRAVFDDTDGTFHPKGTNADDIVYHEYYHVMTAGLKNRMTIAKRIKANVTKRLKMRGKKGGPKQDDIIKYGVSEYATTDADEFGAECFCQALGSKNPSAFAIEVFKETLKYKKYMRGMV